LQNERTRRLLIKGMGMAVCGICRLPDVLGKETAAAVKEAQKVSAEAIAELDNKIKHAEDDDSQRELFELQMSETREDAIKLLGFSLMRIESGASGSKHNVGMQELVKGLHAAGYVKSKEEVRQALLSPALYFCTAISTMCSLQKTLGTLINDPTWETASPQEIRRMLPALTLENMRTSACNVDESEKKQQEKHLQEARLRDAKLTLELGTDGRMLQGGRKFPHDKSLEDHLKYLPLALAYKRAVAENGENASEKPKSVFNLESVTLEEIDNHIDSARGRWEDVCSRLTDDEFEAIIVQPGLKALAMDVSEPET